MTGALQKLHVALCLQRVINSGLVTLPRGTFRRHDPRSFEQRMNDRGGLLWPTPPLQAIFAKMLEAVRSWMAFACTDIGRGMNINSILDKMLGQVEAASPDFQDLVTLPMRQPHRPQAPVISTVARIADCGVADTNPARWGQDAIMGTGSEGWLHDTEYASWADKLFKEIGQSVVNSKKGQLLNILTAQEQADSRKGRAAQTGATRTTLANV